MLHREREKRAKTQNDFHFVIFSPLILTSFIMSFPSPSAYDDEDDVYLKEVFFLSLFYYLLYCRWWVLIFFSLILWFNSDPIECSSSLFNFLVFLLFISLLLLLSFSSCSSLCFLVNFILLISFLINFGLLSFSHFLRVFVIYSVMLERKKEGCTPFLCNIPSDAVFFLFRSLPFHC